MPKPRLTARSRALPTSGHRLERMLASPRYVDGAFRNTAPVTATMEARKGLGLVGELLFKRPQRKPPTPLPTMSPLEGWTRPPDSGLRATWLGHSTVLIEIDGLRVLTDPVWADRASPLRHAGPRRFQPVPVELERLPQLDAVVISHDHYDHLDRGAVLTLARTGVRFHTSLGVGARLEAWGIPVEQIVELDWWESATLPHGALRLTAAPSQHFSGRTLTDRDQTLWSSFVIEGPRHKVFFSGDTGLTPEYAEIRERLGPFDLVMLEVGAFHPSWAAVHMGPENALKAHSLLGGGAFLPVHWGTFSLGLHPWDEPAEVLLREAPKYEASLVMPMLGRPIEPSRVETVEPWWRRISGAREEALAPPTLGASEPLEQS